MSEGWAGGAEFVTDRLHASGFFAGLCLRKPGSRYTVPITIKDVCASVAVRTWARTPIRLMDPVGRVCTRRGEPTMA
jgi:hypothetical protein